MSNLILAIETSIKKGSLSLLDGERELDNWIGNDDSSRSADLLPEIIRLLGQNNLTLKDLQTIAVSIGPGSFTGLRVGVATAKALALSADCQLIGISILEALASVSVSENKIITVVSAGRGLFFWQRFQGKDRRIESAIETGNSKEIERACQVFEADEIFMEPEAFSDCQPENDDLKSNVQLVNENIAKLIGRQALLVGKTDDADILPHYIRPAVAMKIDAK